LKDHYIKKVFREYLGLKFKRVKKIAYQGNSERNLVLRQRFGMKFIELFESGKRIINIDETWLNDTQFIRSKWQLRGSSFSQTAKKVRPRISAIMAFDSHGDVYFALTQVNTNTSVMKVFISQLASRLDVERPNWREDSILLLDGAAYHICPEMRAHLQVL
jgi:hypothetical protein